MGICIMGSGDCVYVIMLVSMFVVMVVNCC